MKNKFIFTQLSTEALTEIVEQAVQQALCRYQSATGDSSVPELMTMEEACEYLGISQSHGYKLTSKGVLPHYKPGKRLYFKKSELDAWINSHRADDTSSIEQSVQQHLTKNRKS